MLFDSCRKMDELQCSGYYSEFRCWAHGVLRAPGTGLIVVSGIVITAAIALHSVENSSIDCFKYRLCTHHNGQAIQIQ